MIFDVTPPPSLSDSLDQLAQSLLGVITDNLAALLASAGILAGVFFVLNLARRWFGADDEEEWKNSSAERNYRSWEEWENSDIERRYRRDHDDWAD